MRVFQIFAAATLLVIASGAVCAQDVTTAPSAAKAVVCALPGPPPSASLRPAPPPPKPAIPSCVNPQTMIGHCKGAVFQSFNAQVTAYNSQLQQRALAANDYINALNRWTQTAVAYAQCEVDEMNAETTAAR
jgi:hypothetical protein